jgi:hypothetical protein
LGQIPKQQTLRQIPNSRLKQIVLIYYLTFTNIDSVLFNDEESTNSHDSEELSHTNKDEQCAQEL